jgi:hypothetical protein
MPSASDSLSLTTQHHQFVSHFSEFGPARFCCSTETYTRVGLSLSFGIAAKGSKRDGGHGCPCPISGNTPSVNFLAD